MKVKVKAIYEWEEEVSDDDLVEICENEGMKPEEDGGFDEDQLDHAFHQWKEQKEESLIGDPVNIADDATCLVEIEPVQ